MGEAPHIRLRDVLTPLALTILQTGGDDAYRELVVRSEGSAEGKRMLTGIRPSQLIAPPVADEEAGNAMLAGLWLWHDCLHESHALSQNLSSASGSFWHAIMHRREGDFSNAKYWYGRCRTHPVLRVIAARTTPVAGAPQSRGTQMMQGNGWDAAAFVDMVEEVHRRRDDARYATAVELQRVEWETLFADCVYAASGTGSILGGGVE